MAIQSMLTPADVLYEQDFLAWTEMMAAALETHSARDLDWAHLAEEIRDLGISQKSALQSHLENVQLHLMKWQIQPVRRSRSWEDSISKSRREIDVLLDSFPSLRTCLLQNFERCHGRAWRRALGETHLPANTPCPRWTLEQVLDPGFLPE
ncbi:MAG: DUF29 domain-containing protein [Acidobacteriota bacterium]